MDFPGGAITNIRVLDGFSNIFWRIYSEDPSATTASEHPASSHILKHLSRLKELELKLRNLDCLASFYPRRFGLWIFSATQDFESLGPLCLDRERSDSSRLVVGTTSLKVSASGSTTALELIRSLTSDSHGGIVNFLGPQKPHGGPSSARPNDNYCNSAAIYASFILAVAGAISLQLIRRHNAIPLGNRTLFTAINRSEYNNPTIVNDDLDALPALTSLRVELNQTGKVIVSLHTISQNGISRLCGLNGSVVDSFDVRSSTDVWLAPNGAIARLVTTSPDRSPVLSPTTQNTRSNEEESSRHHAELELRLWKVNVLEWLGNFGLPVKPVEVETWVEVEVSNPFYAKLIPESRRQNEATQLPYHLKRIPWPAKYCFKRTRAAPVTSLSKIDGFALEDDDPLKFAEDWLAASSFRKERAPSQGSTLPQNQQPKIQDISTPKLDILEGLESLAKVPQYPDLQSASLVYPTPPDGALAPVASHMGSCESDFTPRAAAEGQNIKREEQMLSRTRSGSEIVVSSLVPTSGLGVGSGLYDTNDDDDLFGEMNERDFGSKGISDADFSFFDEPDFDTLGHGKSDTAQEYNKENLSSFYSPTGNFSFEDRKHSYEQVERVTKNKRESKSLNLSTLNVGQRKKKLVEPEPISLDDARQTVSPPLSPLDIRKILFFEFPSFAQRSHSQKTDRVAQHKLTVAKEIRRRSSFEPIFFQRNVFFSDQKYGADGKFFFADKGLLANEGHGVIETDDPIPTIGFPQRGRRIAAGGEPQSSLLANSTNGRRSTSLSSDSSTEDSSDLPSEKVISPTTLTNLKRKRPSLDSSSTTSPLDKPSFSFDIDTASLQVDSSLFLGSLLSIFSDWSLSGYFSVRQNQLTPVLSRKEDQIQLPQLIVDQITQSSLNHRVDGYSGLPDLEHDTYSPRTFFEDTNVIGDIERLDLKSWVSIQDNFIIPSNESSASRVTTQRRELKGSITKIPPPYLRLRRGRDFLEILPPAISFWETFGLEPANGVKNVAAYCIHPHNAREAADAFLDRMGLLYSSCSLGKHSRGEKTKLFDNGLGSWHVTLAGESGYRSTMQSLRVLCETLGGTLSRVPSNKENFVIYIMNPFMHAAALADICSAFLHLFQKYAGDVDRQQSRQHCNDLVLQVIPLEFVSSTSSIVVPTQAEYLNLALEIYNRCPPKDTASAILGCAPPVLLADPVPKSINFKLSPERSSPVQEGKCLHLALSKSVDQRWVTAAWSDNCGSFQLALSYCLRVRGSAVARNLSEVRNEIWETTKDVMEKSQTRWRIFLVKDEPVDQEEIDAWTALVERYNQVKVIPADLTVLSVNIAPDLLLELPFTQIQFNILNPQSSSTPVTTPYTGIPSPDQFGNAATPASGGNGPAGCMTPTDLPSLEHETDSILTDACDESWSVILSQRLSNSHCMTDYRPALASGYLLRRKGVSDNDGIVAMSLNLVYSQRPPTSFEVILKEILGMYRDLATLARARGIIHVQQNTLPWHIATAAKGQEILSYIL